MLHHLAMLAIFTLVAGGAGAASASGTTQAATFPGDVKRIRSPNGDMAVFYLDPGESEDGAHHFSLRLRRKDGQVEVLDTFTRSVDVSWNTSSKRLYVNEHIGSNLADCLAITPGARKTTGRSLTTAIRHAQDLEAAADLQGDHVYVTCGRWISRNKAQLELAGDKFPRTFDHQFT